MIEEAHTWKPPPLQQGVQENSMHILVSTAGAHGLLWGKHTSAQMLWDRDLKQLLCFEI